MLPCQELLFSFYRLLFQFDYLALLYLFYIHIITSIYLKGPRKLRGMGSLKREMVPKKRCNVKDFWIVGKQKGLWVSTYFCIFPYFFVVTSKKAKKKLQMDILISNVFIVATIFKSYLSALTFKFLNEQNNSKRPKFIIINIYYRLKEWLTHGRTNPRPWHNTQRICLAFGG